MSSTLKVGDKVRVVNKTEKYIGYSIGEIATVAAVRGGDIVVDFDDKRKTFYTELRELKLIKGESYMDSIKDYLKEHKSILMTIGVVLLVDHLVFDGAFREKVKEIINKMLGKVEKQLDSKGE